MPPRSTEVVAAQPLTAAGPLESAGSPGLSRPVGPDRPAGPAEPAGRSLRQWLTWAALIAIAISLTGVLGGGAALVRLSEARNRVVSQLDPAIRAALNLSNALVNEESGLRGFVLSGEDDFLLPYTQGRQTEQAAARDLTRALGGDHPVASADLQAVLAAAQAWQTYAEATIAQVRSAGPAISVVRADQGKQLFDVVRAALAGQADRLNALQRQARADLQNAAEVLVWTWAGIAVTLLVGIGALAVGVHRGVTRPLTGLADQVRQVARGDFEHEVRADGPAEILELGSDVDSMRQRILAELSVVRQAHASLDAQTRDLQRSNSELEQFAYVASHDLQEPLRKVASFCQLIEARYQNRLDDRGRQYITFAVDGATRMQTLINDLLAFSRVGRMNAERTVLDGDELLVTARGNLASLIEDTGAVITADPLPRVLGDASLLVAVLQNLIANAVKFRDPERPPQIWLTVRPDADDWLFTCADNGIGIEPQYADRIFIIFQRLHPKGSYAGTGIGLAMCRKIIEYHEGRIWLDVSSRPAGQEHGSRFCFTLPRVEDDLAAKAPALSAPADPAVTSAPAEEGQAREGQADDD